MSLIPSVAALLMREFRRRPLAGDVLLLGKTDVCLSRESLAALAESSDVRLSRPEHDELVDSQFSPGRRVVSDRHFFEALGAASVRSLDASGFEGADIVFDLNAATPTPELEAAFDVIVNPGTLEHVFHLPNALRNLHNMLRPAGRIVHSLPSSNAIEHGFYMFSPCFVRDFYGENGYRLVTVLLLRYRLPTILEFIEVRALEPTEGWGDLTGQCGDHVYGTFAIIEKADGSTGDKVPQQGHYQRAWSARNQAAAPEPDGIAPMLRRAAARHPLLSRLAPEAAKRLVARMLTPPARWTRV